MQTDYQKGHSAGFRDINDKHKSAYFTYKSNVYFRDFWGQSFIVAPNSLEYARGYMDGFEKGKLKIKTYFPYIKPNKEKNSK